jgi:hypothetical protein
LVYKCCVAGGGPGSLVEPPQAVRHAMKAAAIRQSSRREEQYKTLS